MSQRLKNGLISVLMLITAVLFGFFVYGEVKWQTVIGLSLGGFIAWFFIIPRMNKKRAEKEKRSEMCKTC